MIIKRLCFYKLIESLTINKQCGQIQPAYILRLKDCIHSDRDEVSQGFGIAVHYMR